MSFFQNPFTCDFLGVWLLGDRSHQPTFKSPTNAGRGDEIVIMWNKGPFDLSGVDADGATRDTLTMRFAIDVDNFKNWSNIAVDITAGAVSSSAVTVREIFSALNNDEIFSSFFVAELQEFRDGDPRLAIRQKLPVVRLHFYIINGRAEEALRFNLKAGVSELPTYFARHTIASRFDFEDSVNKLIELDPVGSTVDANIIDDAVNAKGVSLGFSSSTVRDDWELLEGRSGIFEFTNVVSGTETIIYHAGAKVGDLAKKIITSGGDTFEIPYTLTISDLITPP